jgi:hypothetical protein
MRDYIISIVVAGMICSFVDLLLDKKTATGKIAKMLTGIFMCVTVLAPLTNISFKHITNYFDSLSVYADNYVKYGKTSAQISICEIIKSQTEAYILDKAKSMGLDVAVEVELDDDNSVPCGVTIVGEVSPYAKGLMVSYIEETIGITRENQQWT